MDITRIFTAPHNTCALRLTSPDTWTVECIPIACLAVVDGSICAAVLKADGSVVLVNAKGMDGFLGLTTGAQVDARGGHCHPRGEFTKGMLVDMFGEAAVQMAKESQAFKLTAPASVAIVMIATLYFVVLGTLLAGVL